ncbi:putative ABC-type branched-chain amino acid transport system, periplasmic component [Bradyrhizobium oligotrophicum S58]|uniref:Putative ABC-type branched-chain amino acid transport system, periplasmic component n=1 Tax=Bradyrhizobium oligotrophicum S58 TaxID=1245469 RepID=M4ZXB6_9BRAD|nr:ABC transporter substrate-binding protein [Bradyrhizobium oligotrophicum]BAM91035.1 putative ABC-type branched-chain amino acid transport system, periplasmic component [Bradyrhizobium oligotrophicum S58]
MVATPSHAAPGENLTVVRDLSGKIGPVIGSALACNDIPRPRIQAVIGKFQAVIREASNNDADRGELTRLFDRHIADGRAAVASGRQDCRRAELQLGDLERSIGAPAAGATPDATVGQLSVAATGATGATTTSPVRGVTDREIIFGSVVPMSGANKESGRLLKVGIEAAFNRVNESGGVNGRMLKLMVADDGYDPNRTLDAMKQLYEKEQVFGFIGNFGTATAAVAIPYSLERRVLFFSPYTGANVTRHDPPDRYVFNYRPSYSEEADALVRYLVKLRRIQPRQIALFAQDDTFGDAGFAGVAKAYRALGLNDAAILRANYARNTVDVEPAINQLKAQKVPVRAVIMVATSRAAAKFIEKAHDALPGVIFVNVSAVGASALANELMLLGPRYAAGVVVTQAVPAVSGYSSLVLDYKVALAKHFPGEPPDYTSLEGYIEASILVQALKKAGPQLDTERLIDTLESMRNIDLGLGALLNFAPAEHQASHKIWGTALDETGAYQAIELE